MIGYIGMHNITSCRDRRTDTVFLSLIFIYFIQKSPHCLEQFARELTTSWGGHPKEAAT